MYKIKQFKYHYYHELEEFLNNQHGAGFTLIQVLQLMSPSGDNEKMHQATILFKLNKI